MTRTILSAVVATLILVALGCYLLFAFHSLWGALSIVLALCIAFPTTIRGGVSEAAHGAHDLKDAGLIVLPVALDAQIGGARKFDPPAPTAPAAPTTTSDADKP